MKAIKLTLGGQDYYLAFNGAAMFAFEDAFGGSGAYFEKSSGMSREAFGAICEAAAILAEQGELVRRAMGYDKGPIPSKDLLMACIMPADMLRLRQAVLNAIVAGYGRQVEGQEDTDMGLVELEQKKTKN